MTRNVPWTDDERAEAKRRWLNGESAGEIGAALGTGRSRNSVMSALDRMGLVGDGAKADRATRVRPVAPPKEPGKPGRPRIHAVSDRTHVPKPKAIPATRSLTVGGSSREQLKQMRPGPKQFHFGNPPAEGEAKPPMDIDRPSFALPVGRPVVPLLDLGNYRETEPNRCRWPHGDPLQPGFGFCGALTAAGKSYCEQHRGRAYHAAPAPIAPLPRRRRAGGRTTFDLATSL